VFVYSIILARSFPFVVAGNFGCCCCLLLDVFLQTMPNVYDNLLMVANESAW